MGRIPPYRRVKSGDREVDDNLRRIEETLRRMAEELERATRREKTFVRQIAFAAFTGTNTSYSNAGVIFASSSAGQCWAPIPLERGMELVGCTVHASHSGANTIDSQIRYMSKNGSGKEVARKSNTSSGSGPGTITFEPFSHTVQRELYPWLFVDLNAASNGVYGATFTYKEP